MNSERNSSPDLLENEGKQLNQETKDRPESSEHDDILLVQESEVESIRPQIPSDTTSEKKFVVEQEEILLLSGGFKLNPLLSLYFIKDKAMEFLLARTASFSEDSRQFIVPTDLLNFSSFLNDVIDFLSLKLNTTQGEEKTSLSIEEKNHSNEVMEVMNVESESKYPPELSRIFSEFLTIVLAHDVANSYFTNQGIVDQTVRLWLMLVETALPIVLTQKEALSVQSGREGKLKKLEADKLAQKGMYVHFEEMLLSMMSGGGRTDHLSPSVYREEVKSALWDAFKLTEQNSVNYDQEKYVKRNTLQRLLNLWSIPSFLDAVVAVDPSEKVIENLNNLANSCPDEFLRLLLYVFASTLVAPETLDWLFKHITCFSNFTWLPGVEHEATRERLEWLKSDKLSKAQRLTIIAYHFDCMLPTFRDSLLAILNLDNPYLIRLMMAANQRHEDRPLYRFIATIPPKKFEEQSNSLLNFNWLIALSGDVDFLKGPYIRENLPVHLRDKLAACLRARLALHRIFSETSSSTSEDDVEWSGSYQEIVDVGAKLQNKYVSVRDVSIKSTTKLAAAAYKETLMRLFSDYYLEPLYFCAQKWSASEECVYKELLGKEVVKCVDCLDEEQLTELSKDWRFVFFLLMRFARSKSASIVDEEIGTIDSARYFSEQLAGQIENFLSRYQTAIDGSWMHMIFQLYQAHFEGDACVPGDLSVAKNSEKNDALAEYASSLLKNSDIKKILNYLSFDYLERIFQKSAINIYLVQQCLAGLASSLVRDGGDVLREDYRQRIESLARLATEEAEALKGLFNKKPYAKEILKSGCSSRRDLYNLVLPEGEVLLKYKNDTDYMRFFVCYACIHYSSEAASKTFVEMFGDVRRTESFQKAFLFYQLFINFDELKLDKNREFLKLTYIKYFCKLLEEDMPFDLDKKVESFWNMISRDTFAVSIVGAVLSTQNLLGKQRSLSIITPSQNNDADRKPSPEEQVVSNNPSTQFSHNNMSTSTTTTPSTYNS